MEVFVTRHINFPDAIRGKSFERIFRPFYFNGRDNLLKTHYPFHRSFRRAIVIYRDPFDAIRSMYALSPAHGPALFQMNTGSILAGHPSVGTWVAYGLGSENENLPGFITITPPNNSGGSQNYGSAFLPAIYQG